MKDFILVIGGIIGGLVLYKQAEKYKQNFRKVLDFDVQQFYQDFVKNGNEILNPELYKEKALGYAHLMSDASAIQYATAIYENLDSPEVIYYVFKNIPSQVQLSQVADKYQDISPESTGNLRQDLLDNLSEFEIAYLNFIINQKGLTNESN